MSWYRRLVRWLAREEMLTAEIAKQESARLAYTATAQAELREKMAYAQGQMAGRQEMADCVLESVMQRMGGADDLVQPEDVATAKKAMLH